MFSRQVGVIGIGSCSDQLKRNAIAQITEQSYSDPIV